MTTVRRRLRTFAVTTGVVVLAALALDRLPAAPWDRAAGFLGVASRQGEWEHLDVQTSMPPGSPADWLEVGRAVDAGGLDPGLEEALGRARERAALDGIDLSVASAYRSADEQAALLAQEIENRGDVEEAVRWVFPPHRSMHVRGLAVDINSGPGADWLERHGDAFGLCKTLAWEWWHFEWRRAWEDDGACPSPAVSPAEAPPP